MITQALVLNNSGAAQGIMQIAQYQINPDQALIVMPLKIQFSNLKITGEENSNYWYLEQYENLNEIMQSMLYTNLIEDNWNFRVSPNPAIFCAEQKHIPSPPYKLSELLCQLLIK